MFWNRISVKATTQISRNPWEALTYFEEARWSSQFCFPVGIQFKSKEKWSFSYCGRTFGSESHACSLCVVLFLPLSFDHFYSWAAHQDNDMLKRAFFCFISFLVNSVILLLIANNYIIYPLKKQAKFKTLSFDSVKDTSPSVTWMKVYPLLCFESFSRNLMDFIKIGQML